MNTPSPQNIWQQLSPLLWRAPTHAFLISLAVLCTFYIFQKPFVISDIDEIDAADIADLALFDSTRGDDSLSPDATALPAIDHIDTADPVAAATSPPAPPPWLEYRIRRGDTMERVLRNINADEAMRQFLVTQKLKTARKLRVKDTLYFRKDENHNITDLLYKTSPEYYLTAGRSASGQLWAEEKPPALTLIRKAVGGIIDSSLFAAGKEAQMPDIALESLIAVLESQIDFYREVRKGDTFRAIYDVWIDDENKVIKMGAVHAMEYKKTNGKTIRAAYNPAGDGGYYSDKGESMRRAFLPAPLKYRRISSRFTNRRFHPVLKRWRSHRGVDYAAPTGTPVRATADGTVSKIDNQRGYGRVIFLKHYGSYSTVYAHLSRFAKGMRKGRAVKQGQVIGYVGQTGLATGPHLHYEFRVNNKHKDPLTYDIPRQLPELKGETLAAFQQHAKPLFAELDTITI